MRLGTSPTGISATCFRVCTSTAEMERAPELETYTNLLSGVKVIHSGTPPVAACPGGKNRGKGQWAINVRVGREDLKKAVAYMVPISQEFPACPTPHAIDGRT